MTPPLGNAMARDLPSPGVGPSVTASPDQGSAMRVLHFTHGTPSYIPPPRLSSDEVIVGPQWPDEKVDGRIRGIRSPRGSFDASEVLPRLGDTWRPDLVVVRVDCTRACLPRNLSAFACPAVLLVGDTHHSFTGIRHGTMLCTHSGMNIRYALSERFEAVCLDYTRQHAHFFVEAGLPRVHWLPGVNVARVPTRRAQSFSHRLTHVGQLGTFHVRRTAIMDALRRAGVPLLATQASASEARQLHATSQLNINCSLNGDLNLRVFEVMQAGSALLTDRLAPEAGLELLLQHGAHLHAYGSADEAVSLARELLADEARCRSLGAAGQARYEELLAPETMARHLLTLARGGDLPPLFSARGDMRTRLIDDASCLDDVMMRVGAYETLQMLHLLSERLSVLATPSVSAKALADLADLPRLRAFRLRGEGWGQGTSRQAHTDALLHRAGVADRMPMLDANDHRSFDVLLVSAADTYEHAIHQLLDRYHSAVILVLGEVSAAHASAMRIEPVPTFPGLWQRPG